MLAGLLILAGIDLACGGPVLTFLWQYLKTAD
jgi:hypothetical protein